MIESGVRAWRGEVTESARQGGHSEVREWTVYGFISEIFLIYNLHMILAAKY